MLTTAQTHCIYEKSLFIKMSNRYHMTEIPFPKEMEICAHITSHTQTFIDRLYINSPKVETTPKPIN